MSIVPDARQVQVNWELVHATYAQPIFRYLRRLTHGNRGEAEDHLQETFLRAWRWLQDHPLDLDTIRPWLYAVARRIVIDAVRSRNVRPAEVGLADNAAQPNVVDDIERLVQAETVRRALLTLSAEHRDALVELYYHQRTAKEAGCILGIPEGTVKSRAHYALRALRTAGLAEARDSQRRPPSVRPRPRPRT